MDKLHEAFGKIAVELGMHDLTRMGSTYLRDPVHICWLTFQSCHNHTLEEAAKVCDDLYLNHKAATNESADAIRALKTQEGK